MKKGRLKMSLSMKDILKIISKRKLNVFTEFSWVVIGQFVGLIGSVLTIKLLTNILSTEEYGRLALGLSISGMVGMFTFNPLSTYVLRYYSIFKERDEIAVFNNVILRSCFVITMVILFLLSLFLIYTFWIKLPDWRLLFTQSVIFAILSGGLLCANSLLKAIRNQKSVAILKITEVCLKLFFAYLLVYSIGRYGVNVILGYSIAIGIVFVSNISILKKEDLLDFNFKKTEGIRKNESELLKFISPLFFFAIFGVITSFADKWVVKSMFTISDVGKYTAIYQIAFIPTLVIGAINGYAMPIIFNYAGDKNKISQDDISNKLLSITIILTIILYLSFISVFFIEGKRIISILTTEEYSNQYVLLWVISIALMIFEIGQQLCYKGYNQKKTSIYIIPKAIYSLVFIIFAYVFSRSIGVKGVAYSLVISSVFYVVGIILANYKLAKK